MSDLWTDIDLVPPEWRIESIGSLVDNVTMDASGEWVGQTFIVPRTGTITKVAFALTGVTTAQNLDVSLETVGATDLKPSGTDYGGSAGGTLSASYSAGIKEVTLGTSATATKGDIAALTIRWVSTAGSITIGRGTTDSLCGTHFPQWSNNGADTSSIVASVVAVYYSDDSTWTIPAGSIHPYSSANGADTLGSTNTSIGIRFTPLYDVRIRSLAFKIREFGSTDTYRAVILIDGGTGSYGTEVSDSADFQFNALAGFLSSPHMPIVSGASLTGGTSYRAVLARVSASSDIWIYRFDLGSSPPTGLLTSIAKAAGMSAIGYTYWNGSAWTNSDRYLPLGMSMKIDQITIGGGGGLLTHPGMVGGLRG